jgi:hypothetical protein
MIDEKEIENFLEHFGVKGQKWGVRKKRDEKARAEKYGNQGMSTKKKVAIAGGIAAGALFAGALIAKQKGLKINDLSRLSSPKTPRNAASLFGVETKTSNARDVFRARGTDPRDIFRSTGTSSKDVFRSTGSSSRDVFRTNTGAIPLGPSSIKINGRTRVKDLPKINGKTQVPPELRTRTMAAIKRARNAPTPESLGIWKPNV